MLQKRNRKSGFSLIEILIAIGVLVVGLAGILALFPAGLKASKNAIQDTQGTLIAESVYESFLASIEIFNNQPLNQSQGKFKFFYDGIVETQDFILPVEVDANKNAVLDVNGFLQPLGIITTETTDDSTFIPGVSNKDEICKIGVGYDKSQSAATHPYNVTVSDSDDHLKQYGFTIEIKSPTTTSNSTLYGVAISIFRNDKRIYKTETQMFISPPPGNPE